MTTISRKIGELLIGKKLISQEHLQKAIKEQDETGEFVGTVLVRMGALREEELLKTLSEQLNIPYIQIKDFVIESRLMEEVPAKLVLHYKFMPLRIENNKMTIAITNPQDARLLDEIRVALRHKYVLKAVLASTEDIAKAIKRYYGVGAETVEGIINRRSQSNEVVSQAQEEKIEDIEVQAEDATIMKLVNQVILEAVKGRASDIHIEPYRKKLQIRYRIDGILYNIEVPPTIYKFLPAIISRIKIMSNLNIVERRLPQDGRATIKIGEDKLDLRISVLPTPHGESVVIRILPSKMLLNLESLGLRVDHQTILSKLILKPYGIIFVTGPTGSGKTTTLYSCLKTINTAERKIITLEDPIEYELEGITQVQVMPQINLTFAAGLRSMLRHDPDVMMVGEVRDFETADLAIRIALTGHLVFSTIHTNDAASAITRLEDMGIDPFLISSSVECFIAQRLIRTICGNCRSEETNSTVIEANRQEMRIDFPGKDLSNVKFFRGQGCEECKNTGYQGRSGIYEFLLLTIPIRELIMKKAAADEIKRKAVSLGMRTLRQDGWEKVLEGVTTPDEILRVTQAHE